MNPTAPSPQAATERLPQRFGETSPGPAANSGGDRLSALLIHLIDLLIQALLSIARNLPAATAPVKAESDPSLSTPRQQQNTPVRPGTPKAKGHSPRRQISNPQELPAPGVGAAPGSDPRPPAGELPSIA